MQEMTGTNLCLEFRKAPDQLMVDIRGEIFEPRQSKSCQFRSCRITLRVNIIPRLKEWN